MINHQKLKNFIIADPKYKPSIYVDVDGTLINPDFTVNIALVEELKQIRSKYTDSILIIVWSSSGQEYATKAATTAGILDIVDICLTKPTFMIDDMGELWHNNIVDIIDYFPVKSSDIVFKP